MMTPYEFLTLWSFNAIIFATAVWVILRATEKIVDIALKIQEYEKKRRAERVQ